MSTTAHISYILFTSAPVSNSATVAMGPRHGLSWEKPEEAFLEDQELRPMWIVQPDVEVITKSLRRRLGIPAGSPCVVQFLAEGAFNKVYTVKWGSNTEYVMRITLPVHPRLKTMSENATIEYVRHHTDIPAPRTFHYNALRDDEVGFEYMIQERVPGTSLKEAWRTMSWLEKEMLVRKVTVYLTQLFNKRFTRMGNIYTTRDLQNLSEADLPDAMLLSADHSMDATGFSMSEIVSIPFFYNDHGSVEVERGPYKHSREWLVAQLELALHNAEILPVLTQDSDSDSDHEEPSDLFPAEGDSQEDAFEDEWSDTDSEITDTESSVTNTDTTMSLSAEDSHSSTIQGSLSSSNLNIASEDDTHSPAAFKARIARLQALLPTIFPATEKESFILHHQDLSDNNILMDSSHALSGIIDWECVHTVPLWLACSVPKFLRGPARESPPPFDEVFENEFYEQAYYDDLEEYEKAQLRKFFFEEMERVCPEWVEIFDDSGLKADFEFAVTMATYPGAVEVLETWLTAVENGDESYDLRLELGQC
jgi:aminoglycoside phosphotransferase (APT) family kinase protein